ncbi:ABC transporter ATP-binding protein [Kribbella alba]|uniref:ABC transporter ATP-binding protein n=1 Tax=Kribbella alba TaxID=190197 RepID=UPI0031D74FA4
MSRPLQDVSLTVGQEPTALVGPSGSGKSTLIRVVAGLQAPDQGTVSINGSAVKHRQSGGVLDPRVSVVYQDYRLVGFLTVAENLQLAAELRDAAADDATIKTLLSKVDLEGFESRHPETLSGGEQQRVSIARALITQPQVLLADEPTGALDSANSARIAQLLLMLAKEDNVSVLVATHDEAVADQTPQRYELVRR